MAEPRVLALFGPTALGKTDVAVVLAERLGAEIVVADSMQVYEGLPVITNQPGESQAARVRHHLVAIVPPQNEFTVAEYARNAHEVIDRLLAAGRSVIVEGGSGLYLRAAVGNLAFVAVGEGHLRRELEASWESGPTEVLEELARLDPATAAAVDTSNPRRVIRALEAVLASGRPLAPGARSSLWRPGERYDHALVALDPGDDRDALRARVNRRVEAMMAAGALEEVAAARRAGPFARTAMQAIGVRELCAVLDGELSEEKAATAIKSRTRALVRRQLTWMRKLPEAAHVVARADPEASAAAILEALGEGP